MSKKTHGSIHHIIPLSRRGERTSRNELKINPDALHDAWHVLFGNLVVEEVIAIIKHVWQDNFGKIQEKYLLGELKKNRKVRKVDKRMSAWEAIFGDTRSVKQAIKIIKETFIKRA